MHADHARNDELQSCQADAGVGQPLKIERQFRIAYVHADLHRDLGQFVELDVQHLHVEDSAVDVAGITLSAGYGHVFVLFQSGGGIAAADHRRDAELAGDNGGVAGAPTAVGDDGRCSFHHRLPIGIGHVGYQHVAGLHFVHLGSVLYQPYRPGTDAVSDRTSGDQHVAAFLQTEAFLRFLPGLHRFGACLQDVKLAVDAVAAPFDVHRPAVVLLDCHGVSAEFLDLAIADRELTAFGLRHLERLHGAARYPAAGEHHAQRLGAETPAQDRRASALQRRLVNVKLVWIDLALYHGLSQPVGGRNENHPVEPRFGIEREQHAGRTLIAAHHLLHACRQCNPGMHEALVHPIRNCAVVVERRENVADRQQHVVEAMNVEKGFLLAGEGGVREILRRGRRTHRERAFSAAVFHECLVRGADLRLQSRRQWRLEYPLADLRARRSQRGHVIDVETGEHLFNSARQSVRRQNLAIRGRGGGEASRNPHTGLSKLADHLAQRGILAAYAVDVGHAKFIKRYDEAWLAHFAVREWRKGKNAILPADPLPVHHNNATQTYRILRLRPHRDHRRDARAQPAHPVRSGLFQRNYASFRRFA